MSSAVLENPVTRGSRDVVTELLVLWQHPGTRRIVPIGRFAQTHAGFAFSYTRAATRVQDFRPLPGLPDLSHRYLTQDIPAVFNQRVMSTDRPDFGVYLETLGLDRSATPWEQIVRSGGGRTGDTLQFMEVPAVQGNRAQARFLANGVRHVPGHTAQLPAGHVTVSVKQHEDALLGLRPGSRLELEPELNNSHDPAAVMLTAAGTPVGWVPRFLAPSVRALLDERGPLSASVLRVADPSAPPHLRLTLALDVPAPRGFAFDPEGSWAPASC